MGVLRDLTKLQQELTYFLKNLECFSTTEYWKQEKKWRNYGETLCDLCYYDLQQIFSLKP